MMTTSTIQLQNTTTPSHRSSLTLYTQEKNANTLLPCLAERKIGGKVAIVPSKMTNGVNSRISEPIDIKETQKTTNQKRGGKIYVSCLETSLSTTWKRSLSQESDKKDINNGNFQSMSSQNPKGKKRNERNKPQSRISNGNNIGTSDNIDLNPRGGKEKAKRKAGKRLERQDSNVSIQLPKGKQLSFSSEGKSSISSHSETNLSSPKHRNSNVYIKSKLNSQHTNTVLVQKSPLCRSITISEASLSSALNRQANINLYNKPISSRTRTSSRYISGISVQNRNKRSFTISNDTTDGRLRTIYESTLEEHE